MRNRRTAILSMAAVGLTAGALAGCTSGPGAGASESPSVTSAAAAVSTAIPTIPPGTGIISATKMTSCDTTGTSVTAKGTVSMPSDHKGDVVVSVSWVNSKNSSVYGRGVTTLKGLAGGDKKEWTTSATLPANAESVACVLGAVVQK